MPITTQACLPADGERFMSMPGPMEIIVILLVVLLLFGAKRLPEIGRALGEGIREFKKSMKEISGDKPEDKK
jgi:TatA/E family protein of Tat protein translocase